MSKKRTRPPRAVHVPDRKRGLTITINLEDLPRSRGAPVPPSRFHHTRARDVATGRRRNPKHKGRTQE